MNAIQQLQEELEQVKKDRDATQSTLMEVEAAKLQYHGMWWKLREKLEIAEKALEEINGYERYLTGEVAKEMRDVADTALQQIREEQKK